MEIEFAEENEDEGPEKATSRVINEWTEKGKIKRMAW